MEFSNHDIQEEASRLFQKLHKVGWNFDDCLLYAPLTLEIQNLKKEQDALILSHSYQTPDIMYGIADSIGDSYNLSVEASRHNCKKIIFCSVYFMGETAKLLNPEKEVIVPKRAGCSLSSSIEASDVSMLREKHPNAAIVCYVNTSAAVKAESDVCCTSANALRIIEALPHDEIIFIPDEYMAKNLQAMTTKKIISWHGKCVVHEHFSPENIDSIRREYPAVKILAHPECSPQVVEAVDYAGGTEGMLKFIKNSDDETFMLVTECGITDRVRVENEDKTIVGSCSLCPYMKEIMLKDIAQALKNPTPDQIISIPDDIAERARKSLERMFELERIVAVGL